MLKFLDIRNVLFPYTVMHLFNETEIISIHPHRIFGNYLLEPGINSCLLPSKPFLQIFVCLYLRFSKHLYMPLMILLCLPNRISYTLTCKQMIIFLEISYKVLLTTRMV